MFRCHTFAVSMHTVQQQRYPVAAQVECVGIAYDQYLRSHDVQILLLGFTSACNEQPTATLW